MGARRPRRIRRLHLSMQAARLLEPRPRTLRAKAIEAARALQLEWRLGKAGVLESG
jgi:penicillin-binding protein 1C